MLGRKLYKTKLCILFQRGRCSRPTCNFAHGEAELRRFSGSFSAEGYGRRDYRSGDLRDRLDRRYSPRQRHSPGRDARGHHSLHRQRPISRDRGSSLSRSPIRRRPRRKELTDGESDASGSLKLSDGNEDRKKGDKFSPYDEKVDVEEQIKQLQLDIELLDDEKSRLENVLEENVDEARKLSSKIDDLELQLNKEQEECQRTASKLKKFVKAHRCYIKAQEEIRRSQSRLQRLSDLVDSDALKHGSNEEDSSVNVAINGEPNGDYRKSPSDQVQNHVSSIRKRTFTYSTTTEEAKAGTSRKRERYSDVISRSEKHIWEGTAPLFENNSKATDTLKHGLVKNTMLAEDDKNLRGKGATFIASDKEKISGVKHLLPSTSMAAHAVDDPTEAIEMEKPEPLQAVNIIDNGDVHRTNLSYVPPPPPVAQNAYKQYEGDDEEVDVEKVDSEMVDVDFNSEVEI